MNLSRMLTALALPSLLALGGATLSASAQDAHREPAGAPAASPAHRARPGDRGRGLDERVARMTERLHLDAAQQASVRQIFEESRRAREALGHETLTAEQHRARQHQIGESTMQRIRALLTPAQAEAFAGHRGERVARREGSPAADQRGHGDARGPRGPMDAQARHGARFMEARFAALGLDESQRAAVQRIMTESRTQREALASEQLTVEQRRARQQAIMANNHQQIRALLRPDQQRLFDEHAARMHERRAVTAGASTPGTSTPRSGI